MNGNGSTQGSGNYGEDSYGSSTYQSSSQNSPQTENGSLFAPNTGVGKVISFYEANPLLLLATIVVLSVLFAGCVTIVRSLMRKKKHGRIS